MQKFELIEDLGRLYPAVSSKEKRRYGIYKCFCGVEFRAISSQVDAGRRKSCGCLKSTQKGLTKHRLYYIWKNIIQRTTSTKSKHYVNYGARGITICDRWLNLSLFVEDMYPSYIEGLSIDRIDNDGNYEPSNCRWATKSVQARNTRRIQAHNTSGYRGVSFAKIPQKWIAGITINSKRIHIGYFDAIAEAVQAYDDYITTHNLEHTPNKAYKKEYSSSLLFITRER